MSNEEFQEIVLTQLTNLTQAIGELDRRMGGMEQHMDKIDQRMGGMEQRMDKIDQRMGGMEQRMDKIDQRMGGMEQRMDKIDQRIDNIEKTMATKEDIARLEGCIDSVICEQQQDIKAMLERTATKEDIAKIVDTQQIHTEWLRQLSADSMQHEAAINCLKIAK